MASRGDTETTRLRSNVESQLNRLLQQLQDLEEMKQELDVEEYESTRNETIEQLKEFEASLNKMVSGNITLVDEFGSVQLAIQSAIRSESKSPEVIRMFAKKENGALRSRIATLDQEFRLGKIHQSLYEDQVSEILQALQKLGETLTPEEQETVNKVVSGRKGYSIASATVGED